MEWVETTGSTIDEAKDLALDQLGVDSADAEFEILEEPKVGLFGRTRGSARVRARVSPRSPRPKTERRRRNKRDDRGGDKPRTEKPARNESTPSSNGGAASAPAKAEASNGGDGDGGRRGGRNTPKPAREPMEVQEQIDVLSSFLEGLGSSFGLQVSAEASSEDDEVRVNLRGDGLGVLVGPRLATLDAIQEIARNALQRQADGREYARVVVDVQGIRQRRKEALGEFVAEAAEQVRTDGVTVVFEVMSSADRKIVHDVTSSLEGVESSSEGEDPRRRVVLRPA